MKSFLPFRWKWKAFPYFLQAYSNVVVLYVVVVDGLYRYVDEGLVL